MTRARLAFEWAAALAVLTIAILTVTTRSIA